MLWVCPGFGQALEWGGVCRGRMAGGSPAQRWQGMGLVCLQVVRRQWQRVEWSGEVGERWLCRRWSASKLVLECCRRGGKEGKRGGDRRLRRWERKKRKKKRKKGRRGSGPNFDVKMEKEEEGGRV